MFTLSYCIFEIPTGALGDRIGPRRVLTRVVLWWSAFTALTGMMSNYYLLLLDQILLRRRGSGRVSERVDCRVAMVPAHPAREHGRRPVDGQPDWRRHRAAPDRAHPDPLRMARCPFSSSACVGVVWAAVWYAWFRDSPAEKSGVSRAELEEAAGFTPAPAHGFPWRAALRSETRAGHDGHRLLLRLRLLVLPDVVSHVPGQGPRFQRGAAWCCRRCRTPSRCARTWRAERPATRWSGVWA